ncbi:MAG: YfiR family protein [Candidatus Thiodiazotropha sp.]
MNLIYVPKLMGYRAKLAVCILLLTAIPLPSHAGKSLSEYRLKAALIYRLTKFVEWPVLYLKQHQRSFGVCLLGEDKFGNALDELEERKVRGLPITVYRFSQSGDINKQCQIVFISDSKRAFVKPILQRMQGIPILTLSDMAEFAEQGGMLQFTTGKNRIGFMINLESAKQSNLTISAPLVDLSTVVIAGPEKIKE